MKFPLFFVYYLYNYYMVCALLSHTHYVTCHVTLVTSLSCDTCDVTLFHTPSYVVSSKEKVK